MKRFVKCKDWIIWLTQHILPNPVIQYKKPEWLKPYRVLAIDASDIVEKGAVKKTVASALCGGYIFLNLQPVQNNRTVHRRKPQKLYARQRMPCHS